MPTFAMNSSGSARQLLLDRKWKHLALHIKAFRLIISFRRSFLSSVLLLAFLLATEVAAAEPGPAASRQNHGAKVTDSDRRCSEVQLLLGSKVKDAGNSSEESPARSGVCSRGSDDVCCTNRTEHQLVARSRTQLEKIVNDRTKLLRQTFFTWTAKFDTFFRELIERSKRNLHDLFLHSYGQIFQQNNQIFVQLYHDLMSHYKSSALSLDDSLDRFFSLLFQRMFALLNDRHVFDREFLDCLVEHIETLRPFDAFPDRIASQVGRTFMVARTFIQGLSEGKAVILLTTKQPPDDRCLNGVTQMLVCPLCQGLSSAKPCAEACVRTASKCLRLQIELIDDWNYYLESLSRVADTLSRSFSIESVVGQLDSLISDAVDSFQANVVNVTSAAFSVCGKPPLVSRKRRGTDLKKETTSEFHSFLPINSSSSSSSSSSASSSLSSSSSSLSFIESSSSSSSIFLSSTTKEGSATTNQVLILGQRQTKEPLEEANEEQNRQRQSTEQPTGQDKRTTRRHKKTRDQRRQKQDGRQEEGQDEERDRQKAGQHKERQRQELRHRTKDEREPQQRQQQKQSKTSENQQQQQQQQQNRRQKQKQQQPKQESAEVEELLTPLQELVRDFRLKLNAVKDVWAKLPTSVCESLNAVESNGTTCWNGAEMTSGSEDGGRGAEPDSAQTSIAKKEMLRLRSVAAKLRQASIGWGDDQETDERGSGLDFGSGAAELGPETLPVIRTSQWPEVAASSTTANSIRNRPSSSSRASTNTSHIAAAISVLSSILLFLLLVFQ